MNFNTKKIPEKSVVVRWLLAVGAIFVLGQKSVMATDPVFTGKWPRGNRGPVQAVQVVNNLAFCAIGEGGLSVLDITNSANPNWVGGCDTPGSAMSISVVGTHVFVADGTALQIINANNPSAPFVEGSYTNCDRVKGVVSSGNFAFIADGTNGIQIIDVSVPATPSRVSGCTFTNGFAEGLAVSGNYAYLAMGVAGLLVIDITNPSTPVVLGRYNTPGYARRVAVSGNYAYVADGSSGIQIINVTVATNPVIAATFSNDSYLQDVKVSGHYVYGGDSGGLNILDISVPSSPSFVAFRTSMDWVSDIFLSSDRAYLAAGANLELFNIADTSEPVLLGTYNSGGNAFDVKIQGDRAYVADTLAGLEIIDISNPTNMVRTGHITNRCFGVAIGETNLVLASESEGMNFYLSDGLGGWTQSGNVDTDGYSYDVSINRNIAYVADGANGLETYEISNPLFPLHLGHFKTNGSFFSGALSGNFGFFADGTNGMDVLDLTDPGSPKQIGLYPAVLRAEAVTLSGNYVYMASGSAGMEIIDASNPTTPIKVGGYDSPGTNGGVALAGNYAYLADGTNGLEVVDITTQTRVGGYNFGGFAEKVAIAGNYAFVTDSKWGLLAFQVAGFSNESPHVIKNPESLTVKVGSTAIFRADAQGAPSLSFQWRLNGTNLSGATASILTVSDVSQSLCGNYSVMVSNSFGTDVSADAILQLVIPMTAINPTKLSSPSRFQFDLPTQANVTYTIEYVDALGDAWQFLKMINGNGAFVPVIDSGASNSFRFYRIKVL